MMNLVDINNCGSSTQSNGRTVDLCHIIKQEINFHHAIMAILVGHELAMPARPENNKIDDDIGTVILALVQGISSSAHTILFLSESTGVHTRDCYGIARTIFETSINACYILAKGKDAAIKANEHSNVKSIKDMNRESRIGESVLDFSYIDSSKFTIPAKIKTDIRKFQTNNGKEKPWTKLSVDKRILAVGDAFGKDVLKTLHLARFIIYRHSSEILHGSLFGCKYFFGATEFQNKKVTPESLTNNFAVQHELILTSCLLSMSSVLDCFHYKYGFESAYIHNKKLLTDLKNNTLDPKDIIETHINK